MSAAKILPYSQEKGRDSSRIIALSLAHCTGPPLVLVTREKFGDEYVLRLPGGKRHLNESAIACARREFREETNYRLKHRDTGFIRMFVFKDKNLSIHKTSVFACGFFDTPKIRKSKDKKVASLHWIQLSHILCGGINYMGPYDCAMQDKHLRYLRAAVENHNLINEVTNHVMVQEPNKVKSTS